MSVVIEMVSDLVCPWCWLGKHRIETAISMVPDVNVQLLFRPYELDPTIPAGGVDYKDYMRKAFSPPEAKERSGAMRQALVDYGEAEGIPDNMCIARWCAIGAVWRRAEPQVVREWRDKLATKATDAVRRKHPNRADIARLADLPFNWSILDADEKFDVLLAANCDPVAEWPSAADIAHRMYADTTRLGFEYFQKNRKAGITTFQDADILRELKALFEKDHDRLKWIDDQVNCFDATTRRSPSK